MKSEVKHECCTAARDFLVAKKVRGENKYRWSIATPPMPSANSTRVTGRVVPVIYCPWCGVHLEANRVAIARQA